MTKDFEHEPGVDYSRPIIQHTKEDNYPNNLLCLEELDARDVAITKVPQLASATCQGQILLKPLGDSIIYTDLKEQGD